LIEPNVKTFWLPKRGNSVEEYEDAYAHSHLHFAIADGATESSFADRWAKGLVEKFIAEPPPGNTPASVPLEQWLAPLQKEWHSGVAWNKLPWYAEEKARSGAFAAFLGVQFSDDGGEKKGFSFFDLFRSRKPEGQLRWRALAVGDANFFQVRSGALTKAFPLERAEQFNSRPLLLSSNPSKNQPVWQRVQIAEGDGGNSDVFFLATDCLAQWCLAQHEAGKPPWKKLSSLESAEDFAKFIDERRNDSSVRNDDMTLVVWQWSNS
jgi:hypothetical protein